MRARRATGPASSSSKRNEQGLTEVLGMSTTLVLWAEGSTGAKQSWEISTSQYQVGRDVGTPTPGKLSVRGDALLSRHHFDVEKGSGEVRIRRSPRAKNPIFHEGNESDSFVLRPGQSFLTGKTKFWLALRETLHDTPANEYTMLRTELALVQQRNSASSFSTMVELLPRLRQTDTPFESALEALELLLPQAIEFKALKLDRGEAGLQITSIAQRGGETPPSRRLLESALEEGSTVAHVWTQDGTGNFEATAHARAAWALVSPILVGDRDQYALYALGNRVAALTESQIEAQRSYLNELAAVLDIVAETVSHHLAVQRMHRFEGQVGQFFSPILRERLTQTDLEQILQPTLREVTVLFFDLRGFSRATESADQEALDTILTHHGLLTDVMTTVTNAVFERGGLVIDYQGDAVLACWGALSDGPEAAEAVDAACDIVEQIHALDLPFESDRGFFTMRCGIGLASGRVVAGQIGAREQIKFGVLGKTVNLASRLEGLTKYLGVPVIIDDQLRQLLPPSRLCRRIGWVRPAGTEEAVEVHEVVNPRSAGGSGIDEQTARGSEEASRLLAAGELDEAYEALLKVARPHDPVGRFLTRKILQFLDEGLPQGWDGTLDFEQK